MEVPGVTVHQSLLHHFPREISISDSFDMRNITQAEQEGNTHEIFEDYKIKYNDEFLEIVIERANNNLKKGWNKIKELKKIM